MSSLHVLIWIFMSALLSLLVFIDIQVLLFPSYRHNHVDIFEHTLSQLLVNETDFKFKLISSPSRNLQSCLTMSASQTIHLRYMHLTFRPYFTPTTIQLRSCSERCNGSTYVCYMNYDRDRIQEDTTTVQMSHPYEMLEINDNQPFICNLPDSFQLLQYKVHYSIGCNAFVKTIQV